MLNHRDERALKESAELYGALCRSVARSILGSDEDAEECLNDALLQIWNAIPPADPENYCAYLMKTVRNLALNRYKAQHREKRGGGQVSQALDELAEIFPAEENVERELEQRELLNTVTEFLQHLPEMLAQTADLDLLDIDAVNQNLAFLNIIVAADQGKDRGLA